MKKLNLILSLCLISTVLKLEAVQIIRVQPQTLRIQHERSPQEMRNQQAEATGAAIGMVVGALIRKSYEERRLIIETRDQIYVEDMLDEYTPDRHEEYVNCIERSALPTTTKMLVIHEFDKIKRAETR